MLTYIDIVHIDLIILLLELINDLLIIIDQLLNFGSVGL